MATSKIIYMKDCGKSFHGRHLKAALEYISAPEKTQQGRLIASVNCQTDFAFEQMKNTKKKFGKIDKRQAYHLIISFKEGEVDADTAFEIAEKFVSEYLSNQYEAVYAVHDNTAHIHAHIVFNSVSFRSGKKYRYEKGDWEKHIQPITNKLCEEYGLSTINIGDEKTESDEYVKIQNANKDSSSVWSDMIARDLDICVVQAESFEQFIDLLHEKGYETKQGKHFAVKPPGMSRFRRCKTIGDRYTEEKIRERILTEKLDSYHTETLEEAEEFIYSQIPKGKRSDLSGIQKKYYARLYKLGLLKRRPYSQAWKYKDDIIRMKQLQEQYLFLIDHDIHSMDELIKTAKSIEEQKRDIAKERSHLYRERKRYDELFQIVDEMKKLKAAENAYRNGDVFLEEEHQNYQELKGKLKIQGYTYEEVERLREQYRIQISRENKEARDARKEISVANSIIKEMEGKEQVKEKEREQLQW